MGECKLTEPGQVFVCELCRDSVEGHIVEADGSVFCSQGCAIAAGAFEAEAWAESYRAAYGSEPHKSVTPEEP